MRTSSASRFFPFVILFFLLGLPALAAAITLDLNEDVGWHLRTAQWMLAEHALPDIDPFSQVGMDEHRRWIAYSWLFELPMYGFYRLLDLTGIMLFRYLLVFMTTLTLAWFVLRGPGDQTWARFVLLLLLVSCWVKNMERPWHFTIVFTALTLDAIIRLQEGTPLRRFWWLPLIYALWANLHVQFVLGLGLLGLALLTACIEQRRGLAPAPTRAGWLALLLLCGSATLVTPFHIRLYGVIWEYATQTVALRLVGELAPSGIERWYNWYYFGLLALAGAAVVRRHVPLWDGLLLLCTAFFAFRMQRDIWFGALGAAAVLVRSPALNKDISDAAVAANTRSFRVLFLTGACSFFAVAFGSQFSAKPFLSIEELRKNEAQKYPVRAVQFVRAHHLPGPLYNSFLWGGYLIWELPEMPVSIDVRTNLYGNDKLKRAFDTLEGKAGWDTDPQLLAARVVIIPRVSPLAPKLLASPRWRLLYEDDTAIVFAPNEKSLNPPGPSPQPSLEGRSRSATFHAREQP